MEQYWIQIFKHSNLITTGITQWVLPIKILKISE